MDLYQSSQFKTPLSPKLFELSYWQNNNKSLRLAGGRGASQKVFIEGKAYVLRRYLRGGLMAKLSYDSYLWLGKTTTRPYKEQQIIAYARQHKLPVPSCAAYCVKQNGLFYRAAIMTEFLANNGTLASYLNEHGLSEKNWQDLSIVIKKMQRACINHADLNADNILVHGLENAKLSFSLIDFDKANIENNLKKWPLNNIKRLHRSLNKLNPKFFSPIGWAHFLAAYRGSC